MAERPWHNNPAPHRRLNTGDRGEDVQRFQTALENRSGIAVSNDGVLGPNTLKVKRKVFYDLGLPQEPGDPVGVSTYPITVGAQANVRWPWTRSLAALRRAKERAELAGLQINYGAGAKAMVETAVRIAQSVHPELGVISGYRPGDPKDHGSDDFDQAARDIWMPGVDALNGPPHPYLDDAVVVIGKAFGREWPRGQTVIDTWSAHGYRLQAIWRTPLYGGHRGHLHLGAKLL